MNTTKLMPELLVNSSLREIDNRIYSIYEDAMSSPYDAKAKVYEWLVQKYWYNKIIWGTSPWDYAEFAENSIVNAKDILLDIGCGGLSQTVRLYSTIENPLVLLDYSIEMLKLGRERILKSFGVLPSNIIFLQANAFNLPFADNTFDGIMSFGMIHMFDNKNQFIQESMRVLKPEGHFNFSVLTTNRILGKRYLTFLSKKNEVGTPVSTENLLSLLTPFSNTICYYIKGNMLFVRGRKL